MNTKLIRKSFKIYDKYPNLVYLDSAASSLTPAVVADEVSDYFNYNSTNVHRGMYNLSYEATEKYENARIKIASYINADQNEIVFTKGASESLNLVAKSYGKANLKKGDHVLTSYHEHHSSHMPWFEVCKKTGAVMDYIELDDNLMITLDNVKKAITDKTKVIAINHMSNVFGYVSPIKEICAYAHSLGIIVTVDGAQAFPHMKIDVKDLDCDFYSFSSHKAFGPTGVGILYGKKEILINMYPDTFGGDMANHVYTDHEDFKDSPYKFETGTPNIGGVLGFSKAIDFLETLDFDEIKAEEEYLTTYVINELSKIDNVTVYNKHGINGIIVFNIKDIHPHDTATVLDQEHICIRAGHHCSELIHHYIGVESTVRVSLYVYNDKADCEILINKVKEAAIFFSEVME